MASGLVNKELTDSGWKTLVSTTNVSIKYRKIGSVCYLDVAAKTTSTTWAVIGALPTGYFPVNHGYGNDYPYIYATVSNQNGTMNVGVHTTNGNIVLQGNLNNTPVRIMMTYLVD